MQRRQFLAKTTGTVLGFATAATTAAQPDEGPEVDRSGARTSNPIAVSTYSFWHFARNELSRRAKEEQI